MRSRYAVKHGGSTRVNSGSKFYDVIYKSKMSAMPIKGQHFMITFHNNRRESEYDILLSL